MNKVHAASDGGKIRPAPPLKVREGRACEYSDGRASFIFRFQNRVKWTGGGAPTYTLSHNLPYPIPQPPHVSRSRLRLFTMPRRRRRSFEQPSRRCPTSPPRCVRAVRRVRTTIRSDRCVQHWVRVVRGQIIISENFPYLPVSPHPSVCVCVSVSSITKLLATLATLATRV